MTMNRHPSQEIEFSRQGCQTHTDLSLSDIESEVIAPRKGAETTVNKSIRLIMFFPILIILVQRVTETDHKIIDRRKFTDCLEMGKIELYELLCLRSSEMFLCLLT